MRNVEIETAQAEKQRIIVQSDEVTTKAKADLAAQIQNQCKERLSEAEPQLEEALNALRTLQVKDFVEMKSFQNPPKLIRLTMDAVCIMNDKKPKKQTAKMTIGRRLRNCSPIQENFLRLSTNITETTYLKRSYKR